MSREPLKPEPKKTGVITLKERRVGQCVVCFKSIDARYVWRNHTVKASDQATARYKQQAYDSLLCDEHAEERMKL